MKKFIRGYITLFEWHGGRERQWSVVEEAELDRARNPGTCRARRDADFLMALLVREPWAAYATAKDMGLQILPVYEIESEP